VYKPKENTFVNKTSWADKLKQPTKPLGRPTQKVGSKGKVVVQSKNVQGKMGENLANLTVDELRRKLESVAAKAGQTMGVIAKKMESKATEVAKPPVSGKTPSVSSSKRSVKRRKARAVKREAKSSPPIGQPSMKDRQDAGPSWAADLSDDWVEPPLPELPAPKVEPPREQRPIKIISVEVDKPKIINTDEGKSIVLTDAANMSVEQVMQVAKVTPEEAAEFEDIRQTFRKQAQAQPGEAKKWLKQSYLVFNQLPIRLLVRAAPQRLLRAKRDMTTNRPYVYGYLHLCDLAGVEVENPGNMIQSSAMIAALSPLTKSWKRQKKGQTKIQNPTPAQS